MLLFRKLAILAPPLLNSKMSKWGYLLAIMGILLLSAFKNMSERPPSTLMTNPSLTPTDSMSVIDHEMKKSLLRDFHLKHLADSLVRYALSLEGKPYRYGGKSPKGFDCSGFIYFVFTEFGFDPNRTSRAQSLQGDQIELAQAKKGDLLFFTGTNQQKRQVGHVGLVISKPHEEVRFVHSSSVGGVKISELKGHYEERILFAKRLLKAE